MGLLRRSREALPRDLEGCTRPRIGSEFQRLPELFCGMERQRGVRLVRYPVSCSPQAWASAAFFMILQATLGLFPEAPARVLHIRNPVLPDFLQELTVSGLSIGDARVSLQLPTAWRSDARECARHGGRTASGTDRAGLSVALRSSPGRWTLAAAVLGSGAVFLEGTWQTSRCLRWAPVRARLRGTAVGSERLPAAAERTHPARWLPGRPVSADPGIRRGTGRLRRRVRLVRRRRKHRRLVDRETGSGRVRRPGCAEQPGLAG